MIKLGRIYKRKPSNKASPYPAYLIPTGVNQLMTTALQTRYYYVDVERERDYGSYECITESSLQLFYELVEGGIDRGMEIGEIRHILLYIG